MRFKNIMYMYMLHFKSQTIRAIIRVKVNVVEYGLSHWSRGRTQRELFLKRTHGWGGGQKGGGQRGGGMCKLCFDCSMNIVFMP